MQRKLTEEQIDQLRQARVLILEGFGWSESVEGDSYWVGVIAKIDAKIKHGTSDGEPWVEPEPELTDQDACVWPRRWVMVRNNSYHAWEGPLEYVGKTVVADDDIRYSVWDKNGYHRWYTQTRRATTEEIDSMIWE